MGPVLDRASLFADPSLAGVELCRAYSGAVDSWLRELCDAGIGPPPGVALVAIGGYGRQELSPCSDLDLMLLHGGRRDIGTLAERIWYPIWDEGLKLGHAVRTVKEALGLASDDLDTATSLLSLRLVAGDESLAQDLAARARAMWEKRSKRWLAELRVSVRNRQDRTGEVAFCLEPDLKDGRGGLRDVHAIRWAEMAQLVTLEGDDAELAEAYETVLSARVELHRRTGRAGDVLLLEEQDGVASALGYPDADEMMLRIAAAARRITWMSDEVWDRIDSALRGPLARRLYRDRDLGDGVILREGLVRLTAEADPGTDPLLALRVAAGAARCAARIERRSLDMLAEHPPELPDPWPREARELLIEMLLVGEPSTAVIEALDQRGIWVHVLPEWSAVQFRSQRNPYHLFTVDRHLCQTAVNAAGLTDRVDRADLLVVAALLHDIGKGRQGDHVEVGVALVEQIAERMGFSPADVTCLGKVVRHHLLLSDVATRRDISDEGTVSMVAEAVGSVEVLRLLDALTEADSLATGPTAWNDWKAELVMQLVARVAHVLGGGSLGELTTDGFPTTAQLTRMAEHRRIIEAANDRLLVISPDRPGIFSCSAGVLALHGLDVIEAAAHTDSDGMALQVFRVESGFDPVILWDRVVADLEKALDGRVALSARLNERARVYARRRSLPAEPGPPSVLVDNELSATSTVVEVRAPDATGTLYKITCAIAELDLDIRSAKIQTVAFEAIDSFYLQDRRGNKILDDDHLAELAQAVLFELRRS